MIQPELLALEFQRQFKEEYGRYPFSIGKVKESKWWIHFTRFANKSKLPNNSEKAFVHLLFSSWDQSNGILYPFVLSQKFSYDTEENLIAKSKTSEITEEDYIKTFIVKCNSWCKQNNITERKLGAFIENDENQFLAERGYYYMPLFLFSKKFINKHGLTEEEILKKNSIRAFNCKIYEALKISLEDDFID